MHRVLAAVLASSAACATPPPAASPSVVAPAPATTAPPAPVAASRASSTPCFAGTAPLRAAAIYEKLEKFSWSLYAAPGDIKPKGTFGSCAVVGNIVTAADGSTVAELGCGVRILKTGILDDLGLEIGATGQDVLDRKPRPQQPLTCIPNGPDQTRCMFDRPPDHDTDGTMYVVDGVLSEPITGAKAVAHFASRTIVEIHVSVWCH